MAKDFSKDAEKLEAFMKARNNRMKFMMVTGGVGGAGVLGLPVVMCLI